MESIERARNSPSVHSVTELKVSEEIGANVGAVVEGGNRQRKKEAAQDDE